MAWIVIDKEDEDDLRQNMRRSMKRDWRKADRNNKDGFREGYRHGYMHGWEDKDREKEWFDDDAEFRSVKHYV